MHGKAPNVSGKALLTAEKPSSSAADPLFSSEAGMQVEHEYHLKGHPWQESKMSITSRRKPPGLEPMGARPTCP
jgi:hypothetical protein